MYEIGWPFDKRIRNLVYVYAVEFVKEGLKIEWMDWSKSIARDLGWRWS